MKIKRFEFNMFPVNCYVISDETGEAAIIDAGCFFPEEQQMLKQYITDNKLTVKHLLNTHLHLDHVFGNPFILREFGLKAEACQLDEFLLAKLPDQCRMFGFSPNEAPVGLGHYIEDGEIIRFGHTELQAIHVPGHSPGGIGRADLEGGDFNELIEQISCRLLTLPDETLVYPGHGEPTSIGKEKMENPFFK